MDHQFLREPPDIQENSSPLAHHLQTPIGLVAVV